MLDEKEGNWADDVPPSSDRWMHGVRRSIFPSASLVPELDDDETTALRMLHRLMIDRGALLTFVGRALEAPTEPAAGEGAVAAARALAMLHGAEPGTDPVHHGAGWTMLVGCLGRSHDRLALLLEACAGPVDGGADASFDERPVDQRLVQAALDVLPRIFDTVWSGAGRRGAAIRRLKFLRDAAGLGVGLEHEWVESLRHGADALVLLRALDAPVTWPELRAKLGALGHRALDGDRVGFLVRTMLDRDRRDHGLSVDAVPAT